MAVGRMMERRNPMRRTPMPRPTKQTLHRHRPLAAVSRKRLGERARRRKVLAEVEYRDGLRCWGADLIPHRCAGPLDGHELVRRAQYPGGHLDPENVRLICRWLHDFVHAHPVTAHAAGLLRHPWERQA